MVAPVFRSLLMSKGSVIPPEPDIYPWLLTRRDPRRITLMANSTDALSYQNYFPTVLWGDLLSNKLVEDRYFYIQFEFVPKTTNNYTVLFEVPGVVRFSYNWQEGWGLIVELEQVGKFYIRTSDIPSTSCTVILGRVDQNSDIQLKIENKYYTLFKSKSSWTQPILTSNTSYGEVTSSANRSSSATQAEWHALDGLKPDPNDQYTYFGWNAGINYFWQWKLPINIEITGLSLYNRATTGTTNYSRTIQFYADENQTIEIGSEVTLAQDSTTLSTVQNITPVTTNTIRAYLLDTYNSTSGYGGIGELYVTANQINTQPSYDAGQLIMYDKTSFHSLELYGQEPPYFNIIWNINNIEVPLNQVTYIGFTVETNVTDHYDMYFSYNSQDRGIYGNGLLHSDQLMLLPEVVGEANSGYLRIEYQGQTYTSDTLHIKVVAEDQIAILLSPSSTILKSLESATVDIVSNSVPNPISINYVVSGNTEAFTVTPNFSQDYTGSIQVTSNTEEGGQVTVCVWVQNESGKWYMSNYATVIATPTGQLEYCNIVVTPTEQTVYIGDWTYYNVSIDTNIEPAPTISDLTLLLESGDSNVQYELIGSNQLGLFPRTVNSSSTVFFRYTSGTGLIYNSNSFIVNCIPFELSGDEYLNVIFEPNDITLKVGESVDVNMTVQTNLEKLPSTYFGSNNWDAFSYTQSGDTITITGVQPGQAQFVLMSYDGSLIFGSMNITVQPNYEYEDTPEGIYKYFLKPTNRETPVYPNGISVYSFYPTSVFEHEVYNGLRLFEVLTEHSEDTTMFSDSLDNLQNTTNRLPLQMWYDYSENKFIVIDENGEYYDMILLSEDLNLNPQQTSYKVTVPCTNPYQGDTLLYSLPDYITSSYIYTKNRTPQSEYVLQENTNYALATKPLDYIYADEECTNVVGLRYPLNSDIFLEYFHYNTIHHSLLNWSNCGVAKMIVGDNYERYFPLVKAFIEDGDITQQGQELQANISDYRMTQLYGTCVTRGYSEISEIFNYYGRFAQTINPLFDSNQQLIGWTFNSIIREEPYNPTFTEYNGPTELDICVFPDHRSLINKDETTRVGFSNIE